MFQRVRQSDAELSRQMVVARSRGGQAVPAGFGGVEAGCQLEIGHAVIGLGHRLLEHGKQRALDPILLAGGHHDTCMN